jgi:CheY-like chemotaxis protein
MVKIAVIDDDPSIVDVFCTMLRFFGYEPDPYTDPAEALKRIPEEEELPALILLDLMMTPITGLQFLEEKRKIARLKDIPVFIVSAWDVPDEDRVRYAKDFCEVIRKPFFPKDIAEKITRELRQGTGGQAGEKA